MLRTGGTRGANLFPKALHADLGETFRIKPVNGQQVAQTVHRVNRVIAQAGRLPPGTQSKNVTEAFVIVDA